MVRLLLFVALLLCSCTTYRPQRFQEKYTIAYQTGALDKTERLLSKRIDKELPAKQFYKSGNAVWLLLDRATTRFVQHNFVGAALDYQLALDAIDYYNQPSLPEKGAQLLLADSVGAYTAPPYEQVLAHFYCALALYAHGDNSNALALLRRTETAGSLPLVKYLFALMLEKRHDTSNARILYQQAAEGLPKIAIDEALAHLDTPTSTLLILYHNGPAPKYISTPAPASLASTAALEIFLAGSGITDYSLASLPGVELPELIPAVPLCAPQVTVNGLSKPLQTWCDIQALATQHLDTIRPLLAARAAARYLIRRAATLAAHREDPLLGNVVDLGMLFANLSTHADTRSWATLPSRIEAARFDLPPGPHTIKIGNQTFSISLKSEELCIINAFHVGANLP